MAMHNFTPPHLVRRPCRRCGTYTQALQNGQMLLRPTCQKCKRSDEAIWRKAMIQRTRIEARRQ